MTEMNRVPNSGESRVNMLMYLRHLAGPIFFLLFPLTVLPRVQSRRKLEILSLFSGIIVLSASNFSNALLYCSTR